MTTQTMQAPVNTELTAAKNNKPTKITSAEMMTAVQKSWQWFEALNGPGVPDFKPSAEIKKLCELLTLCNEVAPVAIFEAIEAPREIIHNEGRHNESKSLVMDYKINCIYETGAGSGSFTFTLPYWARGAAKFFTMFEINEMAPDQDRGEIIETLILNSADLKNIAIALPFCGSDMLRENLTGVYLGSYAGHPAEICATDANKLFFAPLSDNWARNYIIKTQDVKEIIKKSAVKGSEPGPVVISFYDNKTKNGNFVNFEAETPGGIVSGVCVNERYPDYKCVIPQRNDKTQDFEITTDKGAAAPGIYTQGLKNGFESALKTGSIFASRTTHQVRLAVNGSGGLIQSEDIEMCNEMTAEFECSGAGAGIEIGFNSKFLAVCFAAFKGVKSVNMQCEAPNRAALFTAEGLTGTALLMPMILNNY